MAATPIALTTKDNASGQLSSGINNSVTSIPLLTGNGANFPQPYSSTCTSTGAATTLNCTGISATVGGSAVEGKWILNKTDGSVARITTGGVATNAITTTRLLGGSTNVWNSGDVWCIDPFVATLAIVSTSSYGVQSITQYEEVLVTGRSTDTLTVATGGRGYNGTTANTFSTNDYIYLFVSSPITERLKDVLSVLAQQQDTDRTTLATATTNIGTLQDGTYHYVVTTGSANAYVAATPALGSYTAGNLVVMKANFTNTGSATLNLNSLGAKTIKKNDGATNLTANDIVSGQVVVLRYDGTNFQMLSPIGTPASSLSYAKVVYLGASDSGTIGTSSTTLAYFDTHTYTIPANDLINGVAYEFEVGGSLTWGAGSFFLDVALGTTSVIGGNFNITTPTQPEKWILRGTIFGTAAAGGAVSVRGTVAALNDGTSITIPAAGRTHQTPP